MFNMLQLGNAAAQLAEFTRKFEALILLMQMSHKMIQDLHTQLPNASTPESQEEMRVYREKYAALITGEQNVG